MISCCSVFTICVHSNWSQKSFPQEVCGKFLSEFPKIQMFGLEAGPKAQNILDSDVMSFLSVEVVTISREAPFYVS